MRRTLFLATLLACAASASAPAHAAHGVSVTRESAGKYLVGFTAHAYRPFASRQVTIACTSSAPRSPAAGSPRQYLTHVRAPGRRAKVEVHPVAGADVCSLSTRGHGFVVAALSERARRFAADFDAAESVLGVGLVIGLGNFFGGKSAPPFSELPSKLRSQLTRLGSPGATPPGRRVGYYSDGRRHNVIAARGAAGHRVFGEVDGDVSAANLLSVLQVLLDFKIPASSGHLPTGALPPRATPLPQATIAGVTATQTEEKVAIAFDGPDAAAAYQPLAGRTIEVECTKKPQKPSQFVLGNTFDVKAPSQPGTLNVDVTRYLLGRGEYDACFLRPRKGSAPVVEVALSGPGRALVEDRSVGEAIRAVARRAAGDGTSPYPSAASLAQTLGGAVTELASPSATPTDRRVGVFSDGARRLVVVARTLTGHRLFAEYDGDVERGNLQALSGV